MKKFLLSVLAIIGGGFILMMLLGDLGFYKSNADTNNSDSIGNLGEYDVDLVSAAISDEYDVPVLLVKIAFTNYSSSPISYQDVVGVNAYQNNVGLIGYYMHNEDYKANVREGASVELVLGFELRDTTTPVDIDFIIKGGDKKASFVINIDKQEK